jgi:hypothetical protein
MNADVAFAVILGLASGLAAVVFAVTWFGSRKPEEAVPGAASQERVLVDLDKIQELAQQVSKRVQARG